MFGFLFETRRFRDSSETKERLLFVFFFDVEVEESHLRQGLSTKCNGCASDTSRSAHLFLWLSVPRMFVLIFHNDRSCVTSPHGQAKIHHTLVPGVAKLDSSTGSRPGIGHYPLSAFDSPSSQRCEGAPKGPCFYWGCPGF